MNVSAELNYVTIFIIQLQLILFLIFFFAKSSSDFNFSASWELLFYSVTPISSTHVFLNPFSGIGKH